MLEDISLCPNCHCMTKTIRDKTNFEDEEKYRCGKCGGKKNG
jgi:predicted SprT family Zn-dependent metalloprotease